MRGAAVPFSSSSKIRHPFDKCGESTHDGALPVVHGSDSLIVSRALSSSCSYLFGYRDGKAEVNDELQLIQSALSGESQAFGRLVERYQDRLYTAMINVVGNADEAEDVVQEAFIQAYIKLDTFQMNSRFFTWLYRIAFNYALSRRRKNRGQVSLDQNRDATGNEPTDDREGPDANMQRSESIGLLRVAMDKMTEDHRAILVLREMQGMSYEHISEILSIEIGTVRSRLNRARAQLKSFLEQFPDWKP